MDKQEYNAQYFANLFVQVATRDSSRRSFKHGVSSGFGHIPYDTGATQNSVFVSRVAPDSAIVSIGGDAAPYAIYLQYAENVGRSTTFNRHKGFVQEFAKTDFVKELRRLFGEVKVE